ncbi:unnamed protein product, partial [Cladocopium goreaui]
FDKKGIQKGQAEEPVEMRRQDGSCAHKMADEPTKVTYSDGSLTAAMVAWRPDLLACSAESSCIACAASNGILTGNGKKEFCCKDSKTFWQTWKQLMDTLEQGNAPTGNVACVTTKDAVQLRALAETHQIEVDLALVLVDLPTGFEAFGDVTPPGHKGGIWTFKAVWSGSGNASCKVLEIGAAKPLVISPWLPAPLKKPFTEPLWGAKGWITRAQSAEEVQAEEKDAEMPDCPATLTDETQQSQPEASQGQSNKKGPDGSSNGSPEKKKVRTSGFSADKKTKVTEDLDKLGPDGVPQWDLGGFGDCGFRCLVAAQSLRNGKKKEDVVQNIAKLALSFRTKTTLFLAQNDSWHQSWFADPEATEVTEGGDVPTDVSSYLQACKRNNKWFDSFNCFAAAEVLESEVVVFKHLHGQWVYFQKFVPSKCSSKEPIPLFLKNGHFQTIDPSVPLPSHWHDFDPKDVGPALSFLGGGKRAYAGSARGSTTKSAKTGKSDSLFWNPTGVSYFDQVPTPEASQAAVTGEAKNPGPGRALRSDSYNPRLLVLNTGGSPGAWRLLSEDFLDADLVALQVTAQTMGRRGRFQCGLATVPGGHVGPPAQYVSDPSPGEHVRRLRRSLARAYEALQLIHDYWTHQWSGVRPDSTEASKKLAQDFGLFSTSQPWTNISQGELWQAVRNSNGSAGCDGWSGSELKHLPVWTHQVRWLQYDGHTAAQTLPAHRAMPQGDPLSPLLMAVWVSSGLRAIQQEGTAEYSCYMDDRTFWTQDVDGALDRILKWQAWSRTLGIKENPNKTQIVAKTRRQHQELLSKAPQWAKSEIKILGTSSVTQTRNLTDVENSRIADAMARARILASLPLAWSRRIQAFHAFVLSKAAFGWVGRSPTAEVVNKLFNTMTVSMASQRCGARALKKMFFGANTFLSQVLVTRRLARMHRLLKKDPGMAWHMKPFTPVALLRKDMTNLGFCEKEPWVWKVDEDWFQHVPRDEQVVDLRHDAGYGIPQLLHACREAFRRSCLLEFLAHPKRRDATNFRENHEEAALKAAYSEIDFRRTRTFAEALSSCRNLFLGAFMSSACLYRADRKEDLAGLG